MDIKDKSVEKADNVPRKPSWDFHFLKYIAVRMWFQEAS